MNILLVDDSRMSRYWIAKALSRSGHNVVECDNGEEALKRFQEDSFPLVLSDIVMPGMTGIELLKKISALKLEKGTNVVLFTAHGQVELVIEALRAGAYDYLLKPINIQDLLAIIQRIEQTEPRKGNRQMKKRLLCEKRLTPAKRDEPGQETEVLMNANDSFKIGFFSPVMYSILQQAQKYHTDRSIPVLIQGETGTGKELIARIIHNGGTACDEPFVAINVAAISPGLFESELFGYEPGAYTGGLSKGQRGKFDLAQGGTLFLDEIGEIPLELQTKLLRVIEEQEFYRVGGMQKIKTDIRFVCATNVDLASLMKNGSFRQDLYFRLRVGHIELPPLRERVSEIVPLAELFLNYFSARKGKHFSVVGPTTAKILLSYEWPGNVRELRNVIEWAVFMHDDEELKPEHLGLLGHCCSTDNAGQVKRALDPYNFAVPKEMFSLDDYIDRIIEQTLEIHQGNRAAAARMLGMTRRALCCRLERTVNRPTETG